MNIKDFCLAFSVIDDCRRAGITIECRTAVIDVQLPSGAWYTLISDVDVVSELRAFLACHDLQQFRTSEISINTDVDQ